MVSKMKKHFLKTVYMKKRFIRLYGEDEATLCVSGRYESGGILGSTELFERGERRARLNIMK
jgi:hypothetical protein